ncbi:MAG: LAGLIDADG family homing endonuclease [Clostridiales bacterium]|jgi:intein-encoded DNA endonuclease-like protein|uniref:LAGLIDADG family homing endonuclease n=1 Tax=Terrisporobacter sp. TaxID=1965305 RepID=UPI002A45F32D|nr:LAGLIDADG family homing endonuclease [Terrisporobacter sp.]MCI6457649.1 LAGLIDADG family homing endonuclease [Clostridium sp.]MDD5879798.1 LAGLIDADG family homing endonuclease [Clostridiales bacterium]MCI7205342.1 LAGLIDADG family homing endonuclease [Clostridium sp.]MDD7755372.1 LAGLIDADG family homing endonuclease [Clostridiales bacterium]MDY4136725.1 LAGLIDADG family homing endonuclease [Terrisporobacter sp.]
MKKNNFTNEQMKDILELYNSGNSIYAISKLYNVTHKVINRIIIENNLIKRDGRKKHFYNQTIFNNIDSPEKAYWLGFILADGYINEKKAFMRIKLQECDKNHLDKFVKFIDGDKGMIKYETHNITYNKQYYVEVNGREFIKSLNNHNIRQGKSSKEHIAKIPFEYRKDYIRGLFDGDGHIEEKRIDLVGSQEVLEYVQRYLKETCDIHVNRILEHCNTKRIYIGFNRYKVLKHLYYDECISLDRKYKTVKLLLQVAMLKSGKIGSDSLNI